MPSRGLLLFMAAVSLAVQQGEFEEEKIDTVLTTPKMEIHLTRMRGKSIINVGYCRQSDEIRLF